MYDAGLHHQVFSSTVELTVSSPVQNNCSYEQGIAGKSVIRKYMV